LLTDLVDAIEALSEIRRKLIAARELPSPLCEEVVWHLMREEEAAVARVTGLAKEQPAESRVESACLEALAGGPSPGQQPVRVQDAAVALALARLRAVSRRAQL
jgi:hypothetical protein